VKPGSICRPVDRAAGRSGGELTDLSWFRLLISAALIASVAITWPLWNIRVSPALLPAFDLPRVSLGAPLIVAALAALIRPVPGTVLVSILVVYGMAIDQTRMQPEFFSLPILLWGSFPSLSARLIARAHLLALWFYAGLHKILSPDFLSDLGPRMALSLPVIVPHHLLTLGAASFALAEIGTALLAIWPGTRWIVAWIALALHGGILVSLAASGEWRNVAVWPWNVALAFSGFALIAPWKECLPVTIRSAPVFSRLAAATLTVAPIGFYAGIVDAYPAHHLYSSGVARATVYCPAGCRPAQDVNATWYALNVPLPPEPRLFAASFAKTCSPGDVLRIDAPRLLLAPGERSSIVKSCPAGSLPAAHP
jgi:hypothetical protein